MYSNISYSGELKAKVIDVKSWPDTAILCKYDTNDQSFMRGFNQINDDILGEFTSEKCTAKFIPSVESLCNPCVLTPTTLSL